MIVLHVHILFRVYSRRDAKRVGNSDTIPPPLSRPLHVTCNGSDVYRRFELTFDEDDNDEDDYGYGVFPLLDHPLFGFSLVCNDDDF